MFTRPYRFLMSLLFVISLLAMPALLLADGRQEYLNSSLRHACYGGRLAEVKQLLARGAQVNAVSPPNSGALSSAISGMHPEVALFLISKGANVNQPGYRGSTPLMDAVQAGNAR